MYFMNWSCYVDYNVGLNALTVNVHTDNGMQPYKQRVSPQHNLFNGCGSSPYPLPMLQAERAAFKRHQPCQPFSAGVKDYQGSITVNGSSQQPANSGTSSTKVCSPYSATGVMVSAAPSSL